MVSIVRRRRAKGDKRRNHVADKRRHHQFTVTDLIHDDTTDDDAETETGEPRAADGTELSGGEAELGSPVIEDSAANGETDASGKDRPKSSPQQATGIGGDRGG